MLKIDAVKMVREIRDAHYRETKGKTYQEVLKYYRTKAGSRRVLSKAVTASA